MRKTVITILLAATLTGCSYTTTGEYLGVMTGATVGGDLGEAIGWVSSGRRSHFSGAMIGRIVGTAAGAAVGHVATRPKNRSERQEQYYDNGTTNYQTSGGRDYSNEGYAYSEESKKRYSTSVNKRRYTVGDLTIQSVSFEDENGDGRFSKNETCNILYEVSNVSDSPVDVELYITDAEDTKCFELSPGTQTRIAAHKTIRYCAKAYCKRTPAGSSATFGVFVTSQNNGSASDVIRIKMK